MKAVINSTELERELKLIAPVIKKNHVIPITSAVLMEFTKGNVKITGTDLETTAIFHLKCETNNTFDVVIGFEDLLKVCSRLSEPISIELKEKTIHISGDNSNFKFPRVGETEHFPQTTDDELSLSVEVDCDFFFALSNASTCKHKDALKVSMNMPCADFKKKKGITVVGTDANFLYLKDLPAQPTKDARIMIPDSFVQLTKSFQEATLWASEKWIKVESGNKIIYSRLGEATYVSYEMILPKDAVYNFRADKNALKKALQIVGVTASITTSMCTLIFKDGELLINSKDIDFEKEGNTKLTSVSHSVDFESICINGGFMLTLLNLIESNEIEMAFTEPSKTIYIKPVGDDTVTCLLQPLA